MHRFTTHMRQYSGTITVVAVTTLLNCGLWLNDSWATSLLLDLQFDRAAIHRGEIWRLLTGNLLHWSTEHFLLDTVAFAALGGMYEPRLRQHRAWWTLLVVTATAVGLAVLATCQTLSTYRGLSGVDSGLFAAGLFVEIRLAIKRPQHGWIVIPAAAVFLIKLVWESATGSLFFSTDSLGHLGLPVPAAHIAGAVTGAGLLLIRCPILSRLIETPLLVAVDSRGKRMT